MGFDSQLNDLVGSREIFFSDSHICKSELLKDLSNPLSILVDGSTKKSISPV